MHASTWSFPSWQQALADLITDPQELITLLELDPKWIPKAIQASKNFPLRIPRKFLTRIEKNNPDDPLLKQILPLAYRFNQWFSAGAGVAVEYANLTETAALPIFREVDGQANTKVDSTAVGFNLGALFTVSPQTILGVAYRSRITHNFHGNTTFLRINTTPATTTQLIMPNTLIISLAQDLHPKFKLLAEAGWANWSTMKNTIAHIRQFTLVTINDWIDTYRVGVGGQFKLKPALTLQAGVSYDSSPTSAAFRLPDLPMDRQIRLGAGLIYQIIHAVQLGFSYEYINFGNANINNLSPTGNLVGSYARNYANVFQASINVAC